jgi:hypothetical protein
MDSLCVSATELGTFNDRLSYTQISRSLCGSGDGSGSNHYPIKWVTENPPHILFTEWWFMSGFLAYRIVRNRRFLLQAGTPLSMLFRVFIFSIIGFMTLAYVSLEFYKFTNPKAVLLDLQLYSSSHVSSMGYLICFSRAVRPSIFVRYDISYNTLQYHFSRYLFLGVNP